MEIPTGFNTWIAREGVISLIKPLPSLHQWQPARMFKSAVAHIKPKRDHHRSKNTFDNMAAQEAQWPSL